MSNVSEWSVTAGSNNSSPPNGWPEGMARSAVNDAAREMMAALAKWYQDARGSLTLAGGTTAYTLATNNAHTALSDIPVMVVKVNATNTGASTLAVDGLTAKSIVKNGAALAAGDLVINQMILFAYNPGQDRFEILAPFSAAAILALLLTVDGSGSGLDADLLDGLSSAAFAQVANNLTDLANAATAFANIKQTATTGATGVSELATNAEVVTATDTSRVSPVSSMLYHPGVCKAWALVQPDGTVTVGFNVTSASHLGTGDWSVTLTNTMASINYVVVATVESSATRILVVLNRTTTTFEVKIQDAGGSGRDHAFMFSVFGTLA